MTRPTESRALAETLRRIEAMEIVVPSDLDPEEQWRRNGYYVDLDEVRKVIADEARKLPAKPRQRSLLSLLFGDSAFEKVKVCCCGSENPGSHVLLCEKCGKQFCWGILYDVTCPHCSWCGERDEYTKEENDSAID